MHFPTKSSTDVVTLPQGLPVSFDGRDLFLGAVTFHNRPAHHPTGSSSPQWVQKLVVGPTKAIAVAAAVLAGVQDDPDPACTGSSKHALLLLAEDSVNAPTEIAEVQVLVTSAIYDLTKGAIQPTHIATSLKVTTGTFDPAPGDPPATRDAQMWRTMSDLCESLFRNFV